MSDATDHIIAQILDLLHDLSENHVTEENETNQQLAINGAELAMHEVRKEFE